ncbi:MAG: peptide ABC transporter substrate-binding protein [Lysobacteraceae bacterium]
MTISDTAKAQRFFRASRCLLLLATTLLAMPLWARDASTLVRGNGPEPSTLDPARCQEVACGNILRDLFEGLVTEAADGELIPGLAASWSLDDDGRTWTFVLRGDARWSNGEAIDAVQVRDSLRRAFAPETAAPLAALYDGIRHATAVQRGERPPEQLGIDAMDARTLVFHSTRSVPMPALMALPLAFPVHLPSLARHGSAHTRPGNLVSNGAYRLRDWTPQSSVVLERNPHFREAASIEGVRFEVTEDAASELQRFAASGLDITEVVPPGSMAHWRERFGDRLRIAPYLGVFYLGFNLEREPFRDNRALREALSLAVDRDILVRHATGLGESPAYALVPPGVAGYDGPRLGWASLSQSERESLAWQRYVEAGYSADEPLQVELRYNTSTPHRRLALAVAAMWRQVLGVRTELRNEEWKVFVGNRKQRVITQVFRGGWIADVDDPLNFLAAFADDGALNWSGYQDASYRQLIDDARNADSLPIRSAKLADAERQLLDAHAILPLYFYTSKHLVAPRVKGWRDNPLDHHLSRWLSLESFDD